MKSDLVSADSGGIRLERGVENRDVSADGLSPALRIEPATFRRPESKLKD
jgi:hypothetical protein